MYISGIGNNMIDIGRMKRTVQPLPVNLTVSPEEETARIARKTDATLSLNTIIGYERYLNAATVNSIRGQA